MLESEKFMYEGGKKVAKTAEKMYPTVTTPKGNAAERLPEQSYNILQRQTRGMFQFINENLEGFRKCFSREAAFQWFVIVVVGLMTRTDHLGVTSFIRELGIRIPP